MNKVVVVGGGLSGLSAALFSKLKNPNTHVSLYEASKRLGGWIRSENFPDNSVHELGPRTIRVQSPTINYILDVIDKANLTDKIISISKTNNEFQKRYIFTDNQLNLLDFSLIKPAQKPFSESFLSMIIKAGLKNFNHKNNFNDLSLDKFFRSRFGDEIANYVIDPIIRGIYACDSRNVSLQSTFPSLLEMETIGPNVIIGSIRQYLRQIFQSKEKSSDNNHYSECLNRLKIDSSVLSFHGGMETLIKGLKYRLEELNVDIQTGTSIKNLRINRSNRLSLEYSDKSIECDQVILAVPSFISSGLLSSIIPDSDSLNRIPWNTVAVVCLEFHGRLIPFPGFGHLIPSWEIADTLGVIYDSSILPENDCRNRATTRYTVMLGGAWFYPTIDRLTRDQLIDKARDVLRTQIGVEGELFRSTVGVHRNCIPVYNLEHRNIVKDIRKSIDELKLDIRLCGNSYDGVSVSDCVYSAHQAVQSLPI